MEKYFTIFYSSRNNYNMLESEVLININFQNFDLINIDDNSTLEQQEYGSSLCYQNNIKYIPNLDRGIQWAFQTQMENVKTPFSLWLTHDITPITENFFVELNNFIERNFDILINNIGLSGFNLTWYPFSSEYSPNRCGVIGRSPIAKFGNNSKANWYREDFLKMDWDIWSSTPTIECPCDMAVLVNNKLFKKYIIPTNKYHLFLAVDDISMQFLEKNIRNISLTNFHLLHEQRTKEKYGIPKDSSLGAKSGYDNYFGKYGEHLTFWKDRWGFDRGDKTTIYTESNKHRYKGTLIENFMYHDVNKGPLENLNLI